MAFLKVLAVGIPDWKFCAKMHTVLSNVTCKARELNGEATPAQAGVASASRNTPEPIVDYRHETQQSRVPPGQVSLHGMQGRLLWGGLSHVLNEEWLRWQGVTHVLNCLGPQRGTQDSGVLPDPSYTLAEAAHVDGIEYMDWCINHFGCR